MAQISILVLEAIATIGEQKRESGGLPWGLETGGYHGPCRTEGPEKGLYRAAEEENLGLFQK